MTVPNEHDDDLEQEVDEGADIETLKYPDEDDLEGSDQGVDVVKNPLDGENAGEGEAEENARG